MHEKKIENTSVEHWNRFKDLIIPGCQVAITSLPSKFHLNNGGTAGGLVPGLTPTETAAIPPCTRLGMTACVRPVLNWLICFNYTPSYVILLLYLYMIFMYFTVSNLFKKVIFHSFKIALCRVHDIYMHEYITVSQFDCTLNDVNQTYWTQHIW